MRISKRTALLCGYGAAIGLLVFSAVEAFQIQGALSEQHTSIYRTYVDQEDALSRLRRNVSFAANRARDFFLSTTLEHADALKSQLETFEADSQQAFARLKGVPGGVQPLDRAEKELEAFWAALEPIPETMLGAGKGRQYEYLRREIVPRRDGVHETLNRLTDAARRDFERGGLAILDSRRQSSRRLMVLLALSFLAAMLAAVYSVRHVERLEQEAEGRYSAASRARRQFEQLSARLLEVEEEGRKQLSRELQNEIGQMLAMLEIEVAGAHSREPAPELRERLVRARSLVERAMETIRNVSLLLRPALLDDLGLVPALQYQVHEFLRRSGIDCEFTAEAVDERLAENVKTCVYRVVQEALNNCEKHAGASRVRVAVRQEAERLSVEVEDNGRGFEMMRQGNNSRNPGLGLVGLRERAALVGGLVVVDSAPGRGTRISLGIPLRSSSERRAERAGAVA